VTALDVAPPTLARRDIVRAAVLALVVGALFGVATLARTGDAPSPYRNSDGRAFEHVAQDPFGDGAGLARDDGTAYRMGRILSPAAAWVLALGRPAGVMTALMALAIFGFAMSVFFAALLVRSRGAPIGIALAVVCTPFAYFWLFDPTAVADPLVLALLLAAALAYIHDRSALAVVLAALVVLGRESAAIAFVPLAFIDWRREGARYASRWLLALVPYAAWCLWLRLRVGELPFFDPAAARRDAFRFPGVGVIDTFTSSIGLYNELVVLVGLCTVIAAIYVSIRMAWTPVTAMALALAVVIVCFGPSVWGLWGEALRVMATAQAFVLLALAVGIAQRRTRSVQ
jgi:hypothetical protein